MRSWFMPGLSTHLVQILNVGNVPVHVGTGIWHSGYMYDAISGVRPQVRVSTGSSS